MYDEIKKIISDAWLCKSWLEVKEIRVKESDDNMNLLKGGPERARKCPT